MNNATIKLTSAQRSAVEIYVTDPVHEENDGLVELIGSRLVFHCDLDAATTILTDAANSADCGNGTTPDRGACTALTNLSFKVRAAFQAG